MDVKEAYERWAHQYDADENRTRDLEGQVLRRMLADVPFRACLEIGCGTGKNTAWLAERATKVLAVDLSDAMLARAREKVRSPRVTFVQADVLRPWTFGTETFDLATFSLVLEHIRMLGPVFAEAARALVPGGRLYAGELHPFKQYGGTKARFDTPDGLTTVPCFDHHVSDFLKAAHDAGLLLEDLEEHFDTDDRTGPPRILGIRWRKP